jgi:peroxiredoxin
VIRKRWPLGLAATVTVCWCTAVPVLAQEAGIAVGTRAPAVTVKDLDGTPVNLADYLGTKPVLLEFWATWCEVCEQLLPAVRKAHAEFGDRVEFFGVNVTVNQTPARVRRYLEEHRPPFRTLYDEEGVSTRAYLAPTTSYVVVVDGAGRVAYTGTGGAQDLAGVLGHVVAR